MSALNGVEVDVEFAPVSPALSPYVSSFFSTTVRCPDGMVVEDMSHPEWATIRFHNGHVDAVLGPGELAPGPHASLTGPSSVAGRLRTGSVRIVGFGLLPLGWLNLMPKDARDYANRSFALSEVPALAHFEDFAPADIMAPITVLADAWDARLRALLPARPHRDSDLVAAMQLALTDPDIATAGALAAKLGISAARSERIARRAFGFPPAALLKRQRFLRTLARVMLNPGTSWSAGLDDQYYDQAQFTHDFRRAMGMSPSAYMALPRPVIDASIAARARALGNAFLGLHRPSAAD